jgi:hypothetical protein
VNVAAAADRPRSLRIAGTCWYLAIAAGAFETVLAAGHAVAEDDLSLPAVLAQVVFRVMVFALAAWLTRELLRGRSSARTALTVLLSVVGLLSLLIGPVEWLAEGHRPTEAFRGTGGYDLTFAASRLLHVLAVLSATVAMYRPTASRYLGRGRAARLGSMTATR